VSARDAHRGKLGDLSLLARSADSAGMTTFYSSLSRGFPEENFRHPCTMRLVPLVLAAALVGATTKPRRPPLPPEVRVTVLEADAAPVINSSLRDAANIPGGFEGGNTVRVDGVYHLFAHSYPTTGWSEARASSSVTSIQLGLGDSLLAALTLTLTPNPNPQP
jgi:hypothetical protein